MSGFLVHVVRRRELFVFGTVLYYIHNHFDNHLGIPFLIVAHCWDGQICNRKGSVDRVDQISESVVFNCYMSNLSF